ncbi:conserved hypothetical protein [Desulfonatronospira thiodismutans ASO3-1]|uniref:Peptidase C45 acyl-coenzyme A:6-aminopenicillanic acid acyl-transferase n=1 Tax=Desulfonatronospira thiodismutans ASO3-1 TaxID=555779 RepID=D6SPR0_9BACT|nr:C45 family peptidase [Desulfonatronospira thiodismutans]EFI34736.1 conserved hypothetical protein [Desulfonatronospira thiodismutans ASO3-1]
MRSNVFFRPGKVITLLVAVSVVCMLCASSWALAGSNGSQPADVTGESVDEFEGGERYQAGEINILHLSGSYREMGRQYGRLLSKPMQDLYQSAIVEYFKKEKGLSSEDMLLAARGLYEFYPRRFKDIMEGMAETSGLSLEEHILLNALELYGTMSGCSAIFAWDDYTPGGQLIAGRNYDWFDSYTDFAESLTVTVFNPDSGVPATIVTFAGVIYATTGMNAKGLFLELNNALPSGGGLTYTNRVHAISNLMAFLFDYESMEQLDAAMNTTRSNFSYIINTADSRGAYSYEWPPFDLLRRSGDEPGLLVSTNHFVDPSWGLMQQEGTGFRSVERRDNLLEQARKYKGNIDLGKMKDMLDTPLEKGGPTWPDQGDIRTVYQVVAVPESLALWVKVPGFQDWIGIDLKSLFHEQGSEVRGSG